MAYQTGTQFQEDKAGFPMQKFAMDDSRYLVKLSHVETPEEFFLTLPENEDGYHQFYNELNRVYCKCRDEKTLPPPLKDVRVGDHCVVQGRPLFFRGEVYKVKDRNDIDVLDVDTGEVTKSVPAKHLFSVLKNPYLRQTPRYAIPAKLVNIIPPTPGQSRWSDEIVEAFSENYSNRTLYCHFVGREDGVCIVNLLLKNEREVADHMLATGLARRPKMVRSTLPSLEIGETVGGFIKVIVSYVEDFTTFFVQLTKNEDLIGKMSREIHFEYSKHGEKYGKVAPKKGLYCAAEYYPDSHWYRALITARPTPNVVEVQFIDYGNKARVATDKIKELKMEFTKLAAQAIECKLSGVHYSRVPLKEYRDLTESQRLTARIDRVDFGSKVLEVALFLKSGSRQYNVNDYVMGRGPKLPTEPILPGYVAYPKHEYPDSDYDLDSDTEEAEAAASSSRYVGRSRPVRNQRRK